MANPQRWLRAIVRPCSSLTLAALIILPLLVACSHRLEASPSTPEVEGRVVFVAAGDVIPHQAVRESAEARAKAGGADEGWRPLFAEVGDLFQAADFGFVNFETPAAPEHSHGSKPFLFDAPLAMIDGLKASGVKIVSFANNHAMDQGHAGFAETLAHMDEKGLLHVGAAKTKDELLKPIIVEKNGVRVGWLGATRWLNGGRNSSDPNFAHVAFVPYPDAAEYASEISEEQFIEGVRAARAQCDILFVSIHWGVEYAVKPRAQDVDFAHKILEAGASAIVGHHPHVLQPVESYQTADGRKTVIFYSLGNFLSNQSRFYVGGLMPDALGDPRDSLMVRFAAVKTNYGAGGVKTELAEVAVYPAWQENNYVAKQSGRARTSDIYPVLIDRASADLQRRHDELAKVAAPTSEQKIELKREEKILALYAHRRQIIVARTGAEFVQTAPAKVVK